MSLPAQVAKALDAAFQADPWGDTVMSNLADAIRANTAAVQTAARQEAASRALTARAPEPPPPTWVALLAAACAIGAGALNVHQNLARQNQEARADKQTDYEKLRSVAEEDLHRRERLRQEGEDENERRYRTKTRRQAEADFMRRLRTRKPEAPKEEPAPSWWAKHFGTPRTATWR